MDAGYGDEPREGRARGRRGAESKGRDPAGKRMLRAHEADKSWPVPENWVLAEELKRGIKVRCFPEVHGKYS